MWRLFGLVALQTLFLSGGQVLLKLALQQLGKFEWSWAYFKSVLADMWFLACGISFGVATVLWLYILKHFPFSIAYPLSCLSYVFGMVAAILVFHEQVNWMQWLGVFLVLTGCVLIAR